MQNTKIAIIEDDRPISDMYASKFRNLDYQVVAAYDGKEGYEVCKNERPDVILLDLKMPEMTGEELLAKIRETDWGASTKVVVVTNISRDEAPKSLSFLGVSRYVVKAHHTPGQVAEIIKEVLSK